jgi:hypothetical protein
MGEFGRPALGILGGIIGFAIGGPAGAQIGFLGGSIIGAILFPAPKQTHRVSGPKLSDITINKTGLGQGIPILYGRDRLPGIPIYAQGIQEVVTVTTEEQGKGGGGIAIETTTYTYFLTDSRIFSEGPITNFRKIWADGKLIYDASETNLGSISKYINSIHLYLGEEDQVPDPSITARVGAGESEANRGQSKINFIRFPLKNFGNRPPAFTAEVVNSLGSVVIDTHLHWYGYSAFDRRMFSYDEYYYIHVNDETVRWTLPNEYGTISVFNGITGDELSRTSHEQMLFIDYWSSHHPFAGGAVLSRDGRSLYCKTWKTDRDNRADATLGGSMISKYDLLTGQFAYETDPFWNLADQIAGGHIAQIILDDGSIVTGDEHSAFTMGINSTINSQTGVIENEFMAVLEDIGPPTYGSFTRVQIIKLDRASLFKNSVAAGVGTGVDRIYAIEEDFGYDTFQIYMYPLENGNIVQRWEIFPGANNFDSVAIATYGYNTFEFLKFSDVPGLSQRWRDIIGYTAGSITFNILCSDYFTNTLIVGVGGWLVKADAETFEPLEALSPSFFNSYTRTDNANFLTPIQGQVDDGFVWCTFWGTAIPSASQYHAFLLDIEAWIVTRVIPIQSSITNNTGRDFRAPWDNYLENPWHYHPLTHSVVGDAESGAGDFYSWNDATDPGHEDDWYDNDGNNVTARMTDLEKEVYTDTIAVLHAAREFFDRVSDPNDVTLQTVVDDIVERVELDVLKNTNPLSTESVTGYSIRNRGTARGALEVLAEPYQFDLIESDWQIDGVLRSEPDKVWEIPEADLGVSENDPGNVQIVESFLGELDVPKRIEAVYRTPDRDYDTNIQASDFPELVATSENVEALEWNIVFEDDAAKQKVAVLRDLAYAAQDSYELTLPLRYIGMNPNDQIQTTWDGNTELMRINEITLGSNQIIEVKATREDSNAFLQDVESSGFSDQQLLTVNDTLPGPINFFFMDTTLFRDQDANTQGPYMAISSQFSTEAGAAIFRNSGTGEYSFVSSFSTAQLSTAGYTRTVLPDTTDLYVLDTVSTVDVRLLSKTMSLVSITEEQALAEEGNLCMIGSEACIYQTVEQLTERDWRLSDFRRAERGTEWATDTHVIGEQFVLLDVNKVLRISSETADLNTEFTYKIQPTGSDLVTPTFEQHTWTGNDLKPFSPVYVEFTIAGDLTIDWVRRTRYSGGLTDGSEVPLNEETETYEIDFLDSVGGNVLNTYTVTDATSFVYTLANYNADYGTALSEVGDVDLCIYQLSAIVGRGFVTCASYIATTGVAAGVETPAAEQLVLSSTIPTVIEAVGGGQSPTGQLVISTSAPTLFVNQFLDLTIPQGDITLEEDKVPTVQNTKLISPPVGDLLFE